MGRGGVGASRRMGRAFAKDVVAGARVRNHPLVLTGLPHRYSSLSSSGPFRASGPRTFERGNSREQSCACGTAQWRGLRGAGSSGRTPHASPGRGTGGLEGGPLVTPLTCESAVYSLCIRCVPGGRPRFGHDSGRNGRFRGHLRVAGRLRRVVVARRCTHHHLRRVMVETPLGPVRIPPTDRPVFSARPRVRPRIRPARPACPSAAPPSRVPTGSLRAPCGPQPAPYRLRTGSVRAPCGTPVTRSSPVRPPGSWHGGARSRA